MQKVFDEVLIFCPEVKTGGPEALHQLGYQIARHGGNAQVVYYAPFSRVELDGDILRCHCDGSPMPDYFAQYHPQVATETKLGPNTMIVFPEPLVNLAVASKLPCQRALWWLSIDNALSNLQMMEDNLRRDLFADASLVHFYQSDYARSFLQAKGVARYLPLSDYIDQEFVYRSRMTSETVLMRNRGNQVCFFPNKGGALADRFIEQARCRAHRIVLVPICDMTKQQVRNALFNAKIYIDFGHHPGKDRMPREATTAGTVVLLHAAGAAKCFPDHPLRAEYLFTEEDVASGCLLERVEMILDDPEPHSSAQNFYRNTVLMEPERFDLEVRSFFFIGS
jgi:hypothetical protein